MIKLAKLSLVCFSISILFELILLSFTSETDVELSFLCFAFHTLNLICFIFFVINFKTKNPSRIIKIKHGIFVSAIFTLLISSYNFTYHQWINPESLLNRRKQLTTYIESDQFSEIIEKQMNEKPELYTGKSKSDIIEVQLNNISILRPSILFPFSLLGYLVTGMFSSIILTIANHLFLTIRRKQA